MDSTSYRKVSGRKPCIFAQTIAAGATAAITVQPQTLFQGESLVIDTITGSQVSVTIPQVGQASQTFAGPAGAAVPGVVFTPQQYGAQAFEMDVCNPGTQITMNVTNNGTAVLNFVGLLYGSELEAA